MKFLTIDTNQGNHPAIIVGDNEVLDLTQAPDSIFEDSWRPTSVRELFELGDEGLETVRRIKGAAEDNLEAVSSALYPLSDVAFSPPVVDPLACIFSGNELWTPPRRNG
ncbi:MAG: hypothetical protein CM1200mP40_27260 [Gammaproteobacteria bacterium]|nr:MAG: hypothetical protein CM1200mP40_27260 [Gammaproteobacteria bacterium]